MGAALYAAYQRSHLFHRPTSIDDFPLSWSNELREPSSLTVRHGFGEMTNGQYSHFLLGFCGRLSRLIMPFKQNCPSQNFSHFRHVVQFIERVEHVGKVGPANGRWHRFAHVYVFIQLRQAKRFVRGRKLMPHIGVFKQIAACLF